MTDFDLVLPKEVVATQATLELTHHQPRMDVEPLREAQNPVLGEERTDTGSVPACAARDDRRRSEMPGRSK